MPEETDYLLGTVDPLAKVRLRSLGDDPYHVANLTYFTGRPGEGMDPRSITRAQAQALGTRLLELAGEPVAPARVELAPVGRGSGGWLVGSAYADGGGGTPYYHSWTLDGVIQDAEEAHDEPFDVYMRVATVGAKPEITREVVRFG